jgi:hypothetical protein
MVSSLVAANHTASAQAFEITTLHTIGGSENLITSANVALPPGTLTGDPMLGPLADNGGPTRTHALLAGSPAIDQGSNPGNLASDQRGATFLRIYGNSTDIGSFELQPLPERIFGNGFD